MDIISNNQKETEKIANKIAEKSCIGDIYALYGDLGSGKTIFTKYFAKALGIKDSVTSPTFVMEKRYSIKKQGTKNKAQTLIHIDCYRMNSDNIDQHYLAELFDNENSIIIIEWGGKIEKYLPQKTKKIKFEYISENERKIIY